MNSNNLYTSDLYKKMLETIDIGVYFVDTNRKITFWNRGAEEITGFSPEDVVSSHCYNNILNHVNDKGCQICVNGCPLKTTMATGEESEMTVYMHHKLGHRVKIKIKAIPIYENNKIAGAVEIFEKIDDGRQRIKAIEPMDNLSNEELKILALYDQLTGLPNRRYLNSFISSKLTDFNLLDLNFGLLFMDIDNFRNFNNTYGHNFGDKILKIVSNTMVNAIRPVDLAGRWGGEEFIVVLPVINETELSEIAEKIRFLIENSILREDEKEYKVTVSIGGAIVSPDDETVEDIIERADKKMYESKQNGKNRVTI